MGAADCIEGGIDAGGSRVAVVRLSLRTAATKSPAR